MATFINEGQQFKTIKDVLKEFQNAANWGEDFKERVYIKGDKLVYTQGFFYKDKKILDDLIKSWSNGGADHDYFLREHGIDLEVVGNFVENPAEGRHKKYYKNGVVGVELKVKS